MPGSRQSQTAESSRKAVTRIKRAATDMVELVEAFLLLARESELGVEFEWVCVNDVIQGEVERTRLLPIAADVQIHYEEDARMMVETSDKVLSSLAGNLMRNAVAYTGVGDVHVKVERNAIHIQDSGPGMDSNDLDHTGAGLALSDSDTLNITVNPNSTLQDVVCRLVQNNCGSLLVVDQNRDLLGIITERDLIRVAAMLFENADMAKLFWEQYHFEKLLRNLECCVLL